MKKWTAPIAMFATLLACGGPEAAPPDSSGRGVDTPAAARSDAGTTPPGSDAGPDGAAPDEGDPVDASVSAHPDAGTGADAGGAFDPDAGAAPPPPPPTPPDAGTGAASPGCGRPTSGAGAFVARTVTVRGVSRTYRLRVPDGYDPSRPYPVVFRWHGAGGDGLSGGLGIEWVAGSDAIVVSADAIGGFWDLDPAGADVELFDALVDEVRGALCVDDARLYSYGFSRGGGMTNLLACVRPDVLRGAAAVAGLQIWGSARCGGPVATWLLHDRDDGAVPISHGEATRDRMVATNGCASTSSPVSPSPCVRYDGCAADPVVWCETSGYGHNIRGDFAPAAVWAFFQSLR